MATARAITTQRQRNRRSDPPGHGTSMSTNVSTNTNRRTRTPLATGPPAPTSFARCLPASSLPAAVRLPATIRPAGNKNAALPVIAASLLADGPVTSRKHSPHPRRRNAARAARQISARPSSGPRRTPSPSTPRGVKPKPLDPALCTRIRASILLAGPLLARFGKVVLPPPGGDVIGRRRVDTHFLALERLGAVVTVGDTYHDRGAPAGRRRRLSRRAERHRNRKRAHGGGHGDGDAPSCATRPRSRTCRTRRAFWSRSGADIEGIGSNTYVINGGRPLHGASYTIGPDHIEIGSFIGLAAVTNGDMTIDGVRPDDLRSMLLGFDRLGIRGPIRRRPADHRSRPGAADPARPRAVTFRSSRMVRGRPSRPTSCRSPSWPRRSATGWC